LSLIDTISVANGNNQISIMDFEVLCSFDFIFVIEIIATVKKIIFGMEKESWKKNGGTTKIIARVAYLKPSIGLLILLSII
jgi:hypothetical protein